MKLHALTDTWFFIFQALFVLYLLSLAVPDIYEWFLRQSPLSRQKIRLNGICSAKANETILKKTRAIQISQTR